MKWEMSTTDRSSLHTGLEKDLVYCEREDCDGLIGTRDHILWVAERLGPLAFSNPTLFLTKLRTLKLDEPLPPGAGKPLTRGDRIRVLCPKCRQETALQA